MEELFKILADKNRLRILAMLAHKDYCVCQLAHALMITQPSVSKHLKKLKTSGMIDSRQDGLWTVYFLCALKNKTAQKTLGIILKAFSKSLQTKKDLKKAGAISRDKLCSK